MLSFVCYLGSMFLIVLILLRSIRRHQPTSLPRFLVLSACGAIAAVLLGMRNFALVAHGLAWPGSLFLLGSAFLIGRQHTGWRRIVFGTALTLFGLIYLGFGIDGLLIEPTALTVKHYRVPTSKITKPIRIAFLSDIQTDRIGDYERRTLRLLKEQNADLIILGGDYLQVHSRKMEKRLAGEFNTLLKEIDLDAPLGVFAIMGNQENYNAEIPWEKYFEGTKIIPFDRTSHGRVGEIDLALLGMIDSFWKRKFRYGKAPKYRSGKKVSFLMNPLPLPEPERFRVMAGHAPIYALADQSADILLAGHTHGGQIWIPGFGPIITMSRGLPRKWASGATLLPNGAMLIISNGTGLERGRAPRVRLFCRPDFLVIDLVPVEQD